LALLFLGGKGNLGGLAGRRACHQLVDLVELIVPAFLELNLLIQMKLGLGVALDVGARQRGFIQFALPPFENDAGRQDVGQVRRDVRIVGGDVGGDLRLIGADEVGVFADVFGEVV